jgi:hypothetical protein
LFYVLGIGECCAVDLFEYLSYQVWPVPGWGQLVLSFLGLYSS